MKDALLPLGALLDKTRFRSLAKFAGQTIRFALPFSLNALLVPATLPRQFRPLVFVRGSLRDTTNFNPVFSDWDIGLTLDLQNGEEVQSCVSGFVASLSHIKHFFPALGEVEIYSYEEYTELQDLLKHRGSIYGSLRCLRKLRWIEKSATCPGSDSKYQIVKARRSREICFELLGLEKSLAHQQDGWRIAIEKVDHQLSLLIGESTNQTSRGSSDNDTNEPFYQAYLDIDLNSFALGDSSVLNLFAALPPFDVPAVLVKQVMISRQSPEVLRLCRDLSRIEELVVTAVVRGFPVERPGYQEWLRILHETRIRLERSFESNLGS